MSVSACLTCPVCRRFSPGRDGQLDGLLPPVRQHQRRRRRRALLSPVSGVERCPHRGPTPVVVTSSGRRQCSTKTEDNTQDLRRPSSTRHPGDTRRKTTRRILDVRRELVIPETQDGRQHAGSFPSVMNSSSQRQKTKYNMQDHFRPSSTRHPGERSQYAESFSFVINSSSGLHTFAVLSTVDRNTVLHFP